MSVWDSFGRGVQTGGSLADIFFKGQQRRALPGIGDQLRQGDFAGAGADLVANGMVSQGVNVGNVPYQREQQNLNNMLKQQQAGELNEHRDRTFNATQEYRAAQLSKPRGPQSAVAKINADLNAGLITKDQAKNLLANATAPKNGITIGKDGTVTIGGRVKKASEGQAKANIYASRMENSEGIISKLERQGTDFWQQMASKAGMLGNYAKTPEFRKFEQAKRDFINATLRQESGAVISDAEFDNGEKQYFPQPGDDPATIAQKKKNRAIAIQAIREASGPFSVDAKPQQTQYKIQKSIGGKTYGQDANGDWYEVQ